jgi:hypothetical protein
VKICQPASGCHVTGDLCRKNADCCGGENDPTLPGDGHVVCDIASGKAVGICRNPMACNPQGNVCHFKDYACSISSARADCCGGLGAKGGVCELDELGIPRCNGLGACRPAGDTCASAADCCSAPGTVIPCTPDALGVLRCATTTCKPSGGSCTINGDCCTGSLCITPPGSTIGSCSSTPTGGTGGTGSGGTSGIGGTTSGGGTSTGGTTHTGGTGAGGTTSTGGTGGSGVCGEYGQQCTTNAGCCNAVPCDGGICRYPAG